MHFLNEYFSLLILFFFLEFVLVAFLSYRWFGVDHLIDQSEVKDKHIEDLCMTLGDMNVHIEILERFFVEEITHHVVADQNNNIKFFCDAKDPQSIEKCGEFVDSLSRQSITRNNVYVIKPMILFTKINELEYLLRSKELKKKGALQNDRQWEKFE